MKGKGILLRSTTVRTPDKICYDPIYGYATDPFLFWVFAKAPVIIYRGGEWGGGLACG